LDITWTQKKKEKLAIPPAPVSVIHIALSLSFRHMLLVPEKKQ
jgi:hypothetical protein